VSPQAKARIQAVYRHLTREYQVDGPELDELVDALRLNLAELRKQMHGCLDRKEWDALARVGHSIKGVATNIGQNEIRSLGLMLEKEAAAGEQSKLQKAATQVDRLFAELGVDE